MTRGDTLFHLMRHNNQVHNSVVLNRGFGKKWIFLTSCITLLFAWYLFDKKVLPLEIARVSELVFEGALFQMLPITKLNMFNEEFVRNITSMLTPFPIQEAMYKESVGAPGKLLSSNGAKAKYPVIMIPGVVNSSLEVWEGRSCAKKYFRQRVWGTLSMLRILLLDKDCWVEHMKLDTNNYMDPEGIRVRAAQGLESSDFIVPGYWMWSKIIQNLAEVGYDHKNMVMAPYDWRLDFLSLEKRDAYFSKLKSTIEHLVAVSGEKTVIISHSLGSMLWLYFMNWVVQNQSDSIPVGIGGNGGRDWVDKHIHAFVDIAGPKLGVPKSLSCVISGEMKDTVQLGKLETYVIDRLLSKPERTSLFRTWIGPLSMLPKGSKKIWDSCCDRICHNPNIPPGIVEINNPECGLKSKYTFEDSLHLLSKFVSPKLISKLEATFEEVLPDSDELPSSHKYVSKWSNPLQVPLPFAPKATFYSFYGVGKETERGYIYKHLEAKKCDLSENVSMIINTSAEDPSIRLDKGLHHCDGDGTVPLISLGLMSYSFWRKKSHNPSGTRVVTREFKHEPSVSVSEFRGGPKTSDHVDILGNVQLTEDLLKIATGFADSQPLEDQIVSNIEEITKCLDL